MKLWSFKFRRAQSRDSSRNNFLIFWNRDFWNSVVLISKRNLILPWYEPSFFISSERSYPCSRDSTRKDAHRAIRLTRGEHSYSVRIPYVSRLGQRRQCLHSAVKFNSRDLRTHGAECKPILVPAPTISDVGKMAPSWKKGRGCHEITRRPETYRIETVSVLVFQKPDGSARTKKTDTINL